MQTHANMLENLLHDLTPAKASLYIVGLFFLACLLRKAQVAAEIARIGTRAPRIPFRIPYGMSGSPYLQRKDTDKASNRLHRQIHQSKQSLQGCRILEQRDQSRQRNVPSRPRTNRRDRCGYLESDSHNDRPGEHQSHADPPIRGLWKGRVVP